MKNVLTSIRKWKMPLTILSIVFLVALYTRLAVFICQSNFKSEVSSKLILGIIIVTVLVTSALWNLTTIAVYYWEADWKNQLNVFITIGILLFFPILNGIYWRDGIVLSIFKLSVVVIFPLMMVVFGMILKQENSSGIRNKIAIIIFLFTIDGILFFGNDYIVEFSIFCIIMVLGLFIRTKKEQKEYTNRMLVLNSLVYIICVVVTAVICNFNTNFVNPFWEKEYIYELIENAKSWGQINWQGENAYLVDALLFESKDIIHSLFFYFGKVPVLLYLLSLLIFLMILYKCLGRKYRFCKEYYPVYLAAYISIVIQTIMGVLYSFGIVYYETTLPFIGEVESVLNTMCVVLLLHSEYENFKIERFLTDIKDEKMKADDNAVQQYVKQCMEDDLFEWEEDDDEEK